MTLGIGHFQPIVSLITGVLILIHAEATELYRRRLFDLLRRSGLGASPLTGSTSPGAPPTKTGHDTPGHPDRDHLSDDVRAWFWRINPDKRCTQSLADLVGIASAMVVLGLLFG